jgi:hypothetical protein
MRVPLLALSTMVLGLGVLGGTAAVATPAFAATASPATSASDMSQMPGMSGTKSGGPSTGKPTTPDRAAAIRRARLQPIFLEAKLDGRSEVQVAGKPLVGDPDGSATALVRVQGDRVTFAASWKGITAPTAFHIHQGAAGVNGDVKVPLFATPMPDTVTAAAGVVTVSDPAIADALRATPTGFYVNLHSTEFGGGAVRGQLTKLDHPVNLLDLLQGGDEKAFLSGDQEVPEAGKPAVGDPTGRAVGFFQAHDTTVSYAAAWQGIKPTAFHLHKAPFGVNGPVAVPLFATPIPDNVVAVSGSVSGLDAALVKDISTHPSAFYANLHTTDFLGGAARGQVFNRR